MIATISYTAILILAFSYWLQIWKIHIHREVRDISLWYHVLLAVGFGVLIFTAYSEDSTIFLTKQIVTFVPVLIIIAQILYHGYVHHDHWHDEDDPNCAYCSEELEVDWGFCPYCGTDKFKIGQ